MEYKIHCKTIKFEGVCGIYSRYNNRVYTDYKTMNQNLIEKRLNDLSKNEVIETLAQLREEAAKQLEKKDSLIATISLSEGVTFRKKIGIQNELRQYIKNTVEFCDDVLRALKGE